MKNRLNTDLQETVFNNYIAYIKEMRELPLSSEEKSALTKFMFKEEEFTALLNQSDALRDTFYNRKVTINMHTDELVGHVSGNLPVLCKKDNSIYEVKNLGLDPKRFTVTALLKTEGSVYVQDRSLDKNKLLQATISITEEQYRKLAMLTANAQENPPVYQVWGLNHENCIHWLDNTLKEAGIVGGIKNKFDYEKFKQLDFKAIKIPARFYFDDYYIENNQEVINSYKEKMQNGSEHEKKQYDEFLKPFKEAISRRETEKNKASEDQLKNDITMFVSSRPRIKMNAPQRPQPVFNFDEVFEKFTKQGGADNEKEQLINTIATDLKESLQSNNSINKEVCDVLVNEQEEIANASVKEYQELVQKSPENQTVKEVVHFASVLLNAVDKILSLKRDEETNKRLIDQQLQFINTQIGEFEFTYSMLFVQNSTPRLQSPIELQEAMLSQIINSKERMRDFQNGLAKRLKEEVNRFKKSAANIHLCQNNHQYSQEALKRLSNRLSKLNKQGTAEKMASLLGMASHATSEFVSLGKGAMEDGGMMRSLFSTAGMSKATSFATSVNPYLAAAVVGMSILTNLFSKKREREKSTLMEQFNQISQVDRETLAQLQEQIQDNNASVGHIYNLFIATIDPDNNFSPESMLEAGWSLINSCAEKEKIAMKAIKRQKTECENARQLYNKRLKRSMEGHTSDYQSAEIAWNNAKISLQKQKDNLEVIRNNKTPICSEVLIIKSIEKPLQTIHDFVDSFASDENRVEDKILKQLTNDDPEKFKHLQQMCEDAFNESASLTVEENKNQAWSMSFHENAEKLIPNATEQQIETLFNALRQGSTVHSHQQSKDVHIIPDLKLCQIKIGKQWVNVPYDQLIHVFNDSEKDGNLDAIPSWLQNFIASFQQEAAGVINSEVSPEKVKELFEARKSRAQSEMLTTNFYQGLDKYLRHHQEKWQNILATFSGIQGLTQSAATSGIFKRFGIPENSVQTTLKWMGGTQYLLDMYRYSEIIVDIGGNLLGYYSSNNSDGKIYGLFDKVFTSIFVSNGLNLLKTGFDFYNYANGKLPLSPETQTILQQLNRLETILNLQSNSIQRLDQKLESIQSGLEFISNQIFQLIYKMDIYHGEVRGKLSELIQREDFKILKSLKDVVDNDLNEINKVDFTLSIKYRQDKEIEKTLKTLVPMIQRMDLQSKKLGSYLDKPISYETLPFVSSFRFNTIGRLEYLFQNHSKPANTTLLLTVAFLVADLKDKCESFGIAADGLGEIEKLIQEHSKNTLQFMRKLVYYLNTSEEPHNKMNSVFSDIGTHRKQLTEACPHSLKDEYNKWVTPYPHYQTIQDAGIFISSLTQNILENYYKQNRDKINIKAYLKYNERQPVHINDAILIEPIDADRGTYLALPLPEKLIINLEKIHPDLKRLRELENENVLKLRFYYDLSQENDKSPYTFRIWMHYLYFSADGTLKKDYIKDPLTIFQCHSDFLSESLHLPYVVEKHYKYSKQPHLQRVIYALYGLFCHYNLAYEDDYRATDGGKYTYWGSPTNRVVDRVGYGFRRILPINNFTITSFTKTQIIDRISYGNDFSNRQAIGERSTFEIQGLYGLLNKEFHKDKIYYFKSFKPDYLAKKGRENVNATIQADSLNLNQDEYCLKTENIELIPHDRKLIQRSKDIETLEKNLREQKSSYIDTKMFADRHGFTDTFKLYAEQYETLIHIMRLFTSDSYHYGHYVEFLYNEMGLPHWKIFKEKSLESLETYNELKLLFNDKFKTKTLFNKLTQHFNQSQEFNLLIILLNNEWHKTRFPKPPKELYDAMICVKTENDLNNVADTRLRDSYKNQRKMQNYENKTIALLGNQHYMACILDPQNAQTHFHRAITKQVDATLCNVLLDMKDLKISLMTLIKSESPNAVASTFLKANNNLLLTLTVQRNDVKACEALLAIDGLKFDFTLFNGTRSVFLQAAKHKNALLLDKLLYFYGHNIDEGHYEKLGLEKPKENSNYKITHKNRYQFGVYCEHAEVISLMFTDKKLQHWKTYLIETIKTVVFWTVTHNLVHTLKTIHEHYPDWCKDENNIGVAFNIAITFGRINTIQWMLGTGFDPEKIYPGQKKSPYDDALDLSTKKNAFNDKADQILQLIKNHIDNKRHDKTPKEEPKASSVPMQKKNKPVFCSLKQGFFDKSRMDLPDLKKPLQKVNAKKASKN